MMEHELISSDTGITFEDVMNLCNIHANLFKGAIADVEVADMDQEGHPVYVFKQENLALRAALLRIRRIIDQYEQTEDAELKDQLLQGLTRQFDLLGQFENHYTRKERKKSSFPLWSGTVMMHRPRSCGVWTMRFAISSKRLAKPLQQAT